MMERGLRYLDCEMEGGTHSQGHLHSPDQEAPSWGRGQAKEEGLLPGGTG